MTTVINLTKHFNNRNRGVASRPPGGPNKAVFLQRKFTMGKQYRDPMNSLDFGGKLPAIQYILELIQKYEFEDSGFWSWGTDVFRAKCDVSREEDDCIEAIWNYLKEDGAYWRLKARHATQKFNRYREEDRRKALESLKFQAHIVFPVKAGSEKSDLALCMTESDCLVFERLWSECMAQFCGEPTPGPRQMMHLKHDGFFLIPTSKPFYEVDMDLEVFMDWLLSSRARYTQIRGTFSAELTGILVTLQALYKADSICCNPKVFSLRRQLLTYAANHEGVEALFEALV